ncbi:bifunctional [glutamine synthetase] adenylyltransferase/[glutamine synthetase]-adenylyl-L-tyrosine phosphorylase [Nocardioides ganghwensis]|jgi:glutamate-ammonia-ligase adenylyltransferase|uniref:Bifunctional glutamine synthetase adenylyltransferase/adenylyl-removing enzyme n=1 Tax=Nocardioides ganghwensis TaxID=252230 RepID=A0A4Q2S6L8_9ACTN|nr:bifunctional [glutamine synthetase] adenylyltransferase/[glutamine synthetase]-adenylyl-L-tyrosine phosphorylase [Nocardioides ganghwensis]MBD3947883.1 bifunctional [glutamine synthetase] adenylyltransferase/[glutamine synthetase]-adenylyl-L-tyrosine phosphorylase [Nocardioides ganghwensis]RYB97696.1 bifunctional [glutamine synthetase] adenylyltransferase/[glutamine synthetase]-adenylyl-L-tyrosine phosphorylase [Nocardioides ganghwensis]
MSSSGSYVRKGFVDGAAAARGIERLGDAGRPLTDKLAATADPDAALEGLLRLAEVLDEDVEGAGREMLAEVADDEGTAMRLCSVLGASAALTHHLVRHPEHWRELTDPTLGTTRPPAYAVREAMLTAVGADPHAAEPVAGLPDAEAVDALRVEYRRILLRLASRDLAHHVGIDDAAAEISDLAAATLDAALAIARARVGETARAARLAVIAMGKCGGHELNYISDVDVVFVYEPAASESGEVDDGTALRAATQLASQLMRICSDHTREGTIWPVDANLRPEGSQGPLVRTLASHQGYYEKWAKTWEFQALLKARPVAGDPDLGRRYCEMVAPLVWSAAERDGFVADVQAMRRRVIDHIPAHEAERQLKLGSGGLRDVEFAVQLLQLVHGRADTSLREGATLSALAALTQGGYVGREDGERLHEAYSFLRTLEHRIQLHQLRRTHVVPEDEASLRRLGRSLGHLSEPAAQLDKQWRYHRREVRRLHEKLFYRPLLGAVAKLAGPEARLSLEAAEERLAALGYADPRAALRHLEALTSGVSRTSDIQRTLLPVLLEWFADSPDPDAGLFGFRRISESLGRTPWYLTMLRDEGEVAQRLAAILGTSRYATDLLEREPQGVKMLGESLVPLSAEAVLTEMQALVERAETPEAAAVAVRAVRRRELLRIACGELVAGTDVALVGQGLSRLTDATLQATLDIATESVRRQRGLDAAPSRIAVIAMGRYGGFELSYGSDADVMFVHEPVEGVEAQTASSFATAVVSELRRLLSLPASDPPLEVDPDLRPEGKNGPMVRTVESYAAYYAKWSSVWEFQALLRADAVAGDEALRARFTELIDPLRFPADGLPDADVVEVRRIKARVDDERLPRGADRHTHLKLGRGGLADVEWTVQLLQMRHAGRVVELRTPQTLPALEAAAAAGLITAEDAGTLAEAWRLVSRVRNAVTLVRGKPYDQLPRDAQERAAVAGVLGYPQGSSDQMVNDYLRTTRRAHAVVERVFWE